MFYVLIYYIFFREFDLKYDGQAGQASFFKLVTISFLAMR